MFEFRITELAGTLDYGKLRWWLDYPKNGDFHESYSLPVEVRGWILGGEGTEVLIRCEDSVLTAPLWRHRPDVISRVFGDDSSRSASDLCGFQERLSVGPSGFDVGFRSNGSDVWVRRVQLVLKTKVLIGKQGWLFLDNDSNRSVDQYCGRLLLTKHELEAWTHYLGEVSVRAKQAACAWNLLIAPAKEELFPDCYPYDRASLTPIDQFQDFFSSCPEIVFPFKELVKERELAYCRVDTHWSGYGAHLGAVAALDSLGLKGCERHLPSTYTLHSTFGDLGSKVSPKQSGLRLLADCPSSPATLTFDNGITNHGTIWIFENPVGCIAGTLVVFGDSFAGGLIRQFTHVFRRIVHCHSVAAWDQEIIDQEKPEFVLLQTNQRFLLRAPSFEHGIWSSVQRKVEGLDASGRETLATKLRVFEGNGVRYYLERMLAIMGVNPMK